MMLKQILHTGGMMLPLRLLVTTFAAAALATALNGVRAQSSAPQYPTKPLRIITSESGSSNDVATRMIAQEIAGPLGQPVIVDNRPSLIIGQMLSKSTPDGYTMALTAGVLWLGSLTQKADFDPLKDLQPITSVITYPSVLVVNASVPAKSVKELIDLAKAKPGTLNYAGSPDPGAATFLYPELFKAMAGVDIVKISYKGAGPGLIGVMSGESHLIIVNSGSAMAAVKSGKVRALGVTSLQPSPLAPGVPTIASALPGYEAASVAGILAPARTPPAIISRLNQEIVRVLTRADMREKFLSTGNEVAPSTPAEFSARIKAEREKWAKVLTSAGVKLAP
jgi:tripartite-type tricarboxylate transporter receptor subunit TctC